MKILFYSLLMLIFTMQADFRLIKKMNQKSDFMCIDNFGFLYLLKDANVYKYSSSGNLIETFNDLSNGSICCLDTGDPYMLLLYYKELNRILFLDNRLAPIGQPINLDEFELYQVQFVCKSKDFAVWIYDDFDRRLIQFGFNPKGILNEINLNPLNLQSEVKFMREAGNRLYLSTGNRLLIFDSYGTLIKNINMNIPFSFQILNNKLIYLQKNNLIIFEPEANHADTLVIHFSKNNKNALLKNNLLYIQKVDSVFIYKNSANTLH